jgi:hypothetical protein
MSRLEDESELAIVTVCVSLVCLNYDPDAESQI